VDLLLLEDSPDFGCELIEQSPNRVVVQIGGVERQYFARKNGDGLAVMCRLVLRPRPA
jgi:hypothetical protein